MKQTSKRTQLFVQLLLAFCLIGTLKAQTIGYWKFDEKVPGNTADVTPGAILDQSGNGNHATATEAGMIYTNGSFNYGGTSAMKFTLSPDHVTVSDPGGVFNFSPSQSFTLEALIRTINIGQDNVGAILSKANAPTPEYWWRINATGLQQIFISDGNGTRSANGTRRVNDGAWHHIAVVYDAAAQQLRTYVDYQQDGSAAAVINTGGTIGTTNDLKIGAFQTGTRQFDGDMDFARVSLGALTPDNFVQPVTYISEVTPTNGASFLPASTVASFRVRSSIGVPTNNIQVTLSGINVSTQLGFTGNDNDRTVTLPALTANRLYQLAISVTDTQGRIASQTNSFNTFDVNSFVIEGEDYNFSGGQFIDNPELSSNPGPNNYLDRIGVEAIDFHKTNPATITQYRIGDAIGTVISTDFLRQKFIDAQASDPGVVDYAARDFVNGEWVNYSRTFSAGTYRVYARLAKGGTVPMIINLDEVTDGSTTSEQMLSPMGSFRGQPTLNAQTYAFVPLTDALGREIAVPLSGVKTLRLSMISGTAGMSVNYFIFVPETVSQPPFISALSPIAGAGNELSNTTVQITIRNADTQINLPTTQLKLDATTVAPTLTATATGAQITYPASNLSTGLHTVNLTFSDNTGTSITNTWQFRVANQSVRGYWTFNEKTPGNTVSIAPGAILDISGNARNGTANDPAMPYVTGSFNFGNTPALRFNPGFDHVVVPDSTGNFNFTSSITWEAVLRTATTGASLAILAKNGTGDGEGEYWWRLPAATGGVQQIGLNDSKGAKFLSGVNNLNDGNWHHVAMVYDTNVAQIRLYADYTLEATLTNVVFTNAVGRPADLTIGSFINGGSEFDGDIDSIRISNGALTTNQFIARTVALIPSVKTLLPRTNATHVFPKPLIQAEFLNRDTSVLLSSYRIYLDGTEVTANATVATNSTGSFISFRPTVALADGLHTALVTFNDTGSPANFVTNQWSFSVVNNEPIVGFYQFNEKAPGAIADTTPGAIRDSSGNGRNGTVFATNAPGLSYVIGSTNYGSSSALGFTVALASHVAVPDPTGAFNFTPTQSITLEAVIRTTTIGQASVGSILAKQLAATPEWWWRINATGKQQFNINDSTAAKSVNGTAVLNNGLWHHVAVVYDASAKQLRAYVDYVQDGNPTATTYTSLTNTIGNAQDLWVGGFQAGNRLFEGDIDMVRITKAPLDPSWFIPLGGILTDARIISLTGNASLVSFSFNTESGRSYVVQSTAALGTTWADVEIISGDGTTKTVSYPTVGAEKYFRLKVQ